MTDDEELVQHAVALYMQACLEGREPHVFNRPSDSNAPVSKASTHILEEHLRFLTRRTATRSPAAQLLSMRQLRDACSFWDAGDGYLIYMLTIENELDRRRS